MDSDRFDRLTTSFAESGTRRGVLKIAAAGLAALGLGAGLAEDGDAARCKKIGKKCTKKGKKCCGKAKCKKKRCRCGKNKTACGNSCVNLNKSKKHCGACGNACPPEAPDCVKGTCSCRDECCANSDCPGTETCQNGSCVCATECCANADCPTGGECLANGTCICPGQCCFNHECAPNQNCTLVNDTYFCFCKPELVCGPVGNQVCCGANQTCVGTTCVG